MTSDALIRLVDHQNGSTPTHTRPDVAALDADNQVAKLRAALVSNRRISLAMGILMRDQDIDEAEAFARLRRISQDGNRKLLAVAEDVINTRRAPVNS
jgi:AmiR/NasT family two-component response regulator